MATQRKGCGFLITALIILLIGGGIATFLGISTANTVKELNEGLENSKTFITPATLTYTASKDGKATVWLTGDGTDNLGALTVEVTDVASGDTSSHGKLNKTSNMGNQHLVTEFDVKKDNNYKVKVLGAAPGRAFRVSDVSSSAVFAILGKGFGAFGTIGIAAFVAFVFFIIGIVKFFSSKKSTPPAQTPPAA